MLHRRQSHLLAAPSTPRGTYIHIVIIIRVRMYSRHRRVDLFLMDPLVFRVIRFELFADIVRSAHGGRDRGENQPLNPSEDTPRLESPR